MLREDLRCPNIRIIVKLEYINRLSNLGSDGPHHEKLTLCICENICENKDADQRLCFYYTDSTLPLLLIEKTFQASSLFL